LQINGGRRRRRRKVGFVNQWVSVQQVTKNGGETDSRKKNSILISYQFLIIAVMCGDT
jgi:hypothetical protein